MDLTVKDLIRELQKRFPNGDVDGNFEDYCAIWEELRRISSNRWKGVDPKDYPPDLDQATMLDPAELNDLLGRLERLH